ncbi:MAG: phosphoenolpyruvate synthase [Chlorobi bacterium]|nr:phosphoenolpyruvate synthase [Chlorobiota bacterium]
MSIYKEYLESKKYYINETSFKLLMKNRIYKVLLICSNYDAYMLEEDGRIDEQIFNEYVSLNLRYPPVFIQANSSQKAFRILKREQIDLVIAMLSVGDIDTFAFARMVKEIHPNVPIVVLTHFSREVKLRLQKENLSAIDHVFSWLGNANLLLAIIKLIEDRMNVVHDVEIVGVQTILLVEDSIRFYSSYLPIIYKIIFQQSQVFMKEAVNEHQRMLRMRGRPKILLATTYEEAVSIYDKYKNNMLGVITDMRFPVKGKTNAKAGLKLIEHIRKDNEFLTIVLQSAEIENKEIANRIHIGFLNKNSQNLSFELRNNIIRYFAFGDFIFRDPQTMNEIKRAHDLKELQQIIYDIPNSSLEYHIKRNDISKWLNARALFPIAEIVRPLRRADFNSLDEIRDYVYNEIAKFRINKGRGVISKFDKKKFDEYSVFSRIGEGSLGGKARGLAFIDSLIKKYQIFYQYDDVMISIPRTVVLSTDIFDEYMETNGLYEVGLSDKSDNEILEKFIEARLPSYIFEDLVAFLSVIKNPIAVRSSSVLEDSHYQPFAGIYTTYMIPNTEKDRHKMMHMLTNAIKSVYASVFYKSSKAYMEATSNVIDEEKMGIILQEVTGTRYDNYFYPTLSGVARSINFYPIEPEKSEDGIAKIALGLGRIIVEGGMTLRFSPKYPKKIIQLSSPESSIRDTQKHFFALDLNANSFKPSTDDGINILKLNINEAKKGNALKYVASTYDFQNNMVRDGTGYEGKKIITFSNILNHEIFPLADILSNLLEVGEKEMNNPIEIEFAVNLDVPKGSPKIFSFLQIRPVVENNESIGIKLDNINMDKTIIYSKSALGNGIIEDIHDFVYVKPDSFKAADSRTIANEVEKINAMFVKKNRNYILVGPGRWGSSDPWLGIPVKWQQISAARVIIESGLDNYRIDPSQGTHFFQNLTSFRVGYFTINPYINYGHYDLEYLAGFKPVFENNYLRHIRFKNPLVIMIDGKNNTGVIFKEEMYKVRNSKENFNE